MGFRYLLKNNPWVGKVAGGLVSKWLPGVGGAVSTSLNYISQKELAKDAMKRAKKDAQTISDSGESYQPPPPLAPPPQAVFTSGTPEPGGGGMQAMVPGMPMIAIGGGALLLILLMRRK